MAALQNIFKGIPDNIPNELTEILCCSNNIRIERIVSEGHVTPDGTWYDQQQNEFVLLLSGAASIEFAEQEVALQPGDHLTIPAHTKHRVKWTDPKIKSIWLTVFFD